MYFKLPCYNIHILISIQWIYMNTKKIFDKLAKYPFGNRVFSYLLCFKAPYFSSIKPIILSLENGVCTAVINKRRSITNHIGTIHAIAMCNLAELCAGLAIDSALDKGLRWIPKGMNVQYLQKATTKLKAQAIIDKDKIIEGENTVNVEIKDLSNKVIFTAQIKMYVSKKK